MWEHNTEKWHWLSDLYISREWYFIVKHSLLFCKGEPTNEIHFVAFTLQIFSCDIWVLKFHFLKKDIPTSAKVEVLRFQSMKALNCTPPKSCHPNFFVSCVDFLRQKMRSDISYCCYNIYNIFYTKYVSYIVYIKSIGGFPPVLFPTLKNRTSPNYFQWKLIRKSFTFYTKLFLVLV